MSDRTHERRSPAAAETGGLDSAGTAERDGGTDESASDSADETDRSDE